MLGTESLVRVINKLSAQLTNAYETNGQGQVVQCSNANTFLVFLVVHARQGGNA